MFIPEDTCKSNQFTCKNGGCIPDGAECDGYIDCQYTNDHRGRRDSEDESDEENCENFLSTGESLVEISIKVIYLI